MASLVQNNNEHSLTSPEQKCTGEFGALAGDKSPSLPGTTNRGLWKVYMTPGLTSLLGRLGLHSIRDIYVCENDKLSCFVYENCPEKITCMNEIDYKML